MDESQVINILRDLVAFKSISKQENYDIIDYLEQKLRPLGFDMVRIVSPDEPQRANLLCKIGPDQPNGLMLSGHMDVVPPFGQNWQSDPFILTEQEHRLVGRGTADMKGFIAATCHALTKIALDKLTKPLTLLWTYDEEVGCVGSAQAAPILKNHLKYLPAAALIGEPTSFNILRMHAGHVTVKISAQGKGAHSSDPDLGISAIKAINGALNEIFAFEAALKQQVSLEEHFKRPYVIVNVGEIHGGTAVNIVPDQAEVTLGFRPLPNSSIETIFQKILQMCQRVENEHKAKLSASIEKCSPPMMTKEKSALENILLPLANISGSCAAQYSTDGGNLSQAGIECLIFGPGTIDVAHKANEWIDRRDLLLATDKIAMALTRWFF